MQLPQTMALVLIGAGLSLLAGASPEAGAAPSGVPTAGASGLRAAADGEVDVRRERATGRLGFVRVERGGDLLPELAGDDPRAKADAYLARFGEAFGAPSRSLVPDEVVTNPLGTSVTYTQQFRGLPVFGAALRVHLDPDGDVTTVNGELVPVSSVETTPSVTATDAARLAVVTVAEDPWPDRGTSATTPARQPDPALVARDPELVVYRHGLVRGRPGGLTETAWMVEVTDEATVRDQLVLSAKTGRVVNRYSLLDTALDRVVHQGTSAEAPVWSEGDALPGGLDAEQRSVLDSAAETYWLFRNAWGHDSYDGLGARMRSVAGASALRCPNATWDGHVASLCAGVASDDVVAHEWGHAYTEHSHALIYQWQSGALNEAYSDIWGETVDLLNDRLDEGESQGRRAVGASAEDGRSTRWLVGEKSAALGGAIRDLWKPTCFGHPERVADAEYHCQSSDNGGVHINSGVPNHGYALLVDGGTYRGVPVRALGLDRAASIYYQAMTQYQSPASDFADHADALQASCADLLGRRVPRLSTAPSTRTLTDRAVSDDDCAQVAAMIRAVQLRADQSARCGYYPMFGTDVPATCGPGHVARSVLQEDFDGGLAGSGFTVSSQSTYGGPVRPWHEVLPREQPGTRRTAAVRGPAPELGECDRTAADFSSVDYLTSPAVTVGAAGEDRAARLSFAHSVATERFTDGGQVQLSVNAGPFRTVSPRAYLANPPSVLTSATGGNTNPQADATGNVPAFTGTDEGANHTAWGTSLVDLAAAGVSPGDTVRVRFGIGRDGCGGLDGWYLDDLRISVCDERAAPAETDIRRTSTSPRPVRRGVRFALGVRVTSPTGTPAGTVSLRWAGEPLGSARLDARGAAVVRASRGFRADGERRVTLAYPGSAHHAPARTTVTIQVRR